MLIHLKWQLLFDTCPPAAVKQQIWEEPEWSDRSVSHLSPQFTSSFSCSCLSDVLLHKIFTATLGLIVMCLSWHQIWFYGEMVLKRASRRYFPSNTSCKCHHFTVAEHNRHGLVLRFKVFRQFFLMTTWWKSKYNHNPGWMYAKDGVTSTTLSTCKEVVVLYQHRFTSCELLWGMNRKCPQILAVHRYRLSRQHWLITLIDFDTILSHPSFHI